MVKTVYWKSLISIYCHRSITWFYWFLAILFSFVIIVLGIFDSKVADINQETFDTVMQMRWISPEASKDIVILDIDEKSLAEMAPKYGRFPWTRDVFAQVLAELEYAGAKSVMFTLIVADPDKDHEHSDATLSFVASESFVTVYPLVRLSAKNDPYSKLKVCDIIPAGAMKCHTDKTMAAILPGLPGMRHDLGIMNHQPDDDGILRQWRLTWKEPGWKMLTIVGGALALSHTSPAVDWNASYILNWRSHKKAYETISFYDYLAYLEGDKRLSKGFFKGKHVVIAASAPGLTVPKPTSTGLKTDGEILATALDDAINGTYLKIMPIWLVSLLSMVFIWGMALLFMFGRSPSGFDKLFILMEVAAIALIVMAVNYTTYFLDLFPLVTYGLFYYTIGRLHYIMADRVLMGEADYVEKVAQDTRLNSFGIIVFNSNAGHFFLGSRAMVKLQKKFQYEKIFFCHGLFKDHKILGNKNHIDCIVIISSVATQTVALNQVYACLKQHGIKKQTTQIFDFPQVVDSNRNMVPDFIAAKMLRVFSRVNP